MIDFLSNYFSECLENVNAFIFQHKCRIWNIEREYNMGDVVLGISIINGLGVIN